MGLFEKARFLADARLRAMLEPGVAAPLDLLKRAILELDGYRRELASQLAQHANEETFLSKQLAGRSAALALWRARRALAEGRGRPDLVAAAGERAAREAAEQEAIAKRRGLLHAAVANLTVGLEKVERTLKLVREKKRLAEAVEKGGAPRRAPEEAAGAAGATSGPIEAGFAAEPEDPLEAEFRRLEHEEVTRTLDRRQGPPAGASPEGAPGAPAPGNGA